MREISTARRKVVVMASSLASMSGIGPLLFHHNHLALGIWAGLMLTLIVWVIVLMVRLRRDEGCE